MLTDKYLSVPTVVFVGFRSLYVGGHVPGAAFHGTASTDQGLAELQAWAATVPRSTDLVIYCGCCPFDKCPNIRPAYTAMSSMGFKKRSEEHTSELQSLTNLVCRLLLEKKNNVIN